MRRYLLFAGDQYYPAGGWHDFQGSFDSVAEAKEDYERHRWLKYWDWGHVVDAETQEQWDWRPES